MNTNTERTYKMGFQLVEIIVYLDEDSTLLVLHNTILFATDKHSPTVEHNNQTTSRRKRPRLGWRSTAKNAQRFFPFSIEREKYERHRRQNRISCFVSPWPLSTFAFLLTLPFFHFRFEIFSNFRSSPGELNASTLRQYPLDTFIL